MSPHGGALWPLEKAGHGGAELHLSMGILFSKSCQRFPGTKCRSVDCCHRRRRDKSRVEACCLKAGDEFMCESGQTLRFTAQEFATKCV